MRYTQLAIVAIVACISGSLLVSAAPVGTPVVPPLAYRNPQSRDADTHKHDKVSFVPGPDDTSNNRHVATSRHEPNGVEHLMRRTAPSSPPSCSGSPNSVDITDFWKSRKPQSEHRRNSGEVDANKQDIVDPRSSTIRPPSQASSVDIADYFSHKGKKPQTRETGSVDAQSKADAASASGSPDTPVEAPPKISAFDRFMMELLTSLAQGQARRY